MARPYKSDRNRLLFFTFHRPAGQGDAMRAFISFCFMFILSACSSKEQLPPECYEPGGCSDVTDTGDDTGDTAALAPDDTGDSDDTEDPAPDTGSDDDSGDTGDGTNIDDEINCWYDVPFEIKNLAVDYTVAETVPGDWTGLDWVDYDPIFILDGSTNNISIDLYESCATSSSYEGTISIPDDFTMRDPSDSVYNNGIVTALQEDGTVMEVNYFMECDDGRYAGWVLPDSDPFSACGAGYDSSRWVGGHGGSHVTGTQAIMPGDLTSSSPIGRPLPVEVDHTHLYCDPAETDGFNCFTGPIAASGDFDAANIYSGSIEGLTMGSILVLPQDYDCTEMRTTPGERLCEVARDHFLFIVDDSFGTNEVAFPMEDSVRDEILAEYDIDVHDVVGDYASDVEDIFLDIEAVTNPEEAVK